VQTFVQRCFLNLEEDVQLSDAAANEWKWMKAYRVWEANRKVFLFPENWLEPELRDQKSPFFKDIESTLLQSDITDDTAGAAVLGYLSKLHDVAHLVPVGMYIEEKLPGEADDIVHVVARSDTGSQKYYYRRYEYNYWTPWEEVKLAIEDTPVLPVVWNNRLILFWLKVLKQTPQDIPDPSGPDTGALSTLKMGEVTRAAQGNAANVKVRLQAVLCWSEYYNGKWQPAHSSDVSQALDLGTLSAADAAAFDRSRIGLWSDELSEGLRITVSSPNNTIAFRLYNTHAQPDDIRPYGSPYGKTRSFGQDGKLYIHYRDAIPDVPPTQLTRTPLTDSAKITIVQPNHRVSDPWTAPFFCEDNRNVFYVTSVQTQVTVADFSGIGVTPGPSTSVIPEIPPIVLYPIPKPGPNPWVVDPVNWAVTDPAPITDFIGNDSYIRQGFATGGTVQFGASTIGPAGVSLKQF